MAEVERAQIDEVENQNHLGPVEVGAHKEHDKGEVEEVVHDEVAADAGSGMNMGLIAREQVANVAGLEDEENNPEHLSVFTRKQAEKKKVPENVGNNTVHGKRSGIEIVLIPDATSDGMAIVGSMRSVIDGDDEGDEPSDEGQNLVGEDSLLGMRILLTEGVICETVSR